MGAPLEGTPNCRCLLTATDHIKKENCSAWSEADSVIEKVHGKCMDVDPPYSNMGYRRYPAKYGLQCEEQKEWGLNVCAKNESYTYDASLKDKPELGAPEMLLEPVKGWCSEPWCYVDPCKCSTPDQADSTAFQSYEVQLTYSYAACLSQDDYTAAHTDKKPGGNKCANVDASGVPDPRSSSSLLGCLLVLSALF